MNSGSLILPTDSGHRLSSLGLVYHTVSWRQEKNWVRAVHAMVITECQGEVACYPQDDRWGSGLADPTTGCVDFSRNMQGEATILTHNGKVYTFPSLHR